MKPQIDFMKNEIHRTLSRILFALALGVLTSQGPLVFCQSGAWNITPAGTNNSPVQVVVKLTDSSCVIGTTTLTAFPLRSEALGTMTIPLDKIRSLKFSPDHESVIVSLANGDKLQGSLGAISLKLQTIFGPITIPLEKTTEIEIRTGGVKLVEWDFLPFQTDSNWGGSKGAATVIEKDAILLQGQPVRTRETYPSPLTTEFNASLEDRTATDGNLRVMFLRAGQPKNADPTGYIMFCLTYRNNGQDELELYGQGGRLWQQPFTVEAGLAYHIKLELRPETGIVVTINGKTFELTSGQVSFSPVAIQLQGWQPTDRWHVRNFTVR